MNWKSILASLVLVISWVSASAQISDCSFPPSVAGHEGGPLTLVGAGVRTNWLKPINAVALYAHRKVNTWDEIVGGEFEARADVVFYVARFSGEDLRASWKERFSVILNSRQLSLYSTTIDSVLRLFVDVERGGKLSFVSTRQGLTLSLNGKSLGQVGDLAFGRAVLSSWFGDKPASADLKLSVFRGEAVKNLPCLK